MGKESQFHKDKLHFKCDIHLLKNMTMLFFPTSLIIAFCLYCHNMAFQACKLYRASNLMELLDSTLVLQDDQKLEVTQLINTTLLCLQRNEEHQPTMACVVAILQGDIASEVVLVNDEVEDQYKDTINLLQAFRRIDLDPINEESESWIGTSLKWEVDSSERNSTLINAMIELDHMRLK